MKIIKQLYIILPAFLLLLLFAPLSIYAANANQPPITLTIHKLLVDEGKNLVLEQNGAEIKDPENWHIYQNDSHTSLADLQGINGIEFTVTRVQDNTQTPDNAAPYTGDGAYTKASTTANINGADGIAYFENLPPGIYLIEETNHKGYNTANEKFLIQALLPAPSGDGFVYDIHIYPKNTVRRSDGFTKEIKYRLGNDVTWAFQWNIPQNIGNGESLVIKDVLDSRLELQYNNGKPAITLYYTDISGGETPLNSRYYKLSVSGNTIIVTIDTDAAFHELAKVFTPKRNNQTPTLSVELTTTIKDNAAGNIPNTGTVTFKTKTPNVPKPSGPNPSKPSQPAKPKDPADPKDPKDKGEDNEYAPWYPEEDPSVEVEKGIGGLLVYKFDDETQEPLSGAVFTLYASLTDANNGNNPVSSGNTTGADGYLLLDGLAYEGESAVYWLVETKAPQGYNPLKDPVQVVVNGTSHLKENRLDVANNSGVTVPGTKEKPGGNASVPRSVGTGPTPYRVTGLLLIIGAVVLYLWWKERNQKP